MTAHFREHNECPADELQDTIQPLLKMCNRITDFLLYILFHCLRKRERK
jgi:hypothetical protein